MTHREFLEGIREGGFYDWVDERKTFTTNTDYLNERYYNNPEWPSSDDSESKIRRFISEAREAEEAIVQDLVEEGMDEDEAIFEGSQWPLKENAPIEAIRAYLRYVEEDAEASEKGLIID